MSVFAHRWKMLRLFCSIGTFTSSPTCCHVLQWHPRIKFATCPFCFSVDEKISQVIVRNMWFGKRKPATQRNHTSTSKHTREFKRSWTSRIHKIWKHWKYKKEKLRKPGNRYTYKFQKVRGLNFLELLESNPVSLDPAAPGRLWPLNENNAILQENSFLFYWYNIVPSLWPRTSKFTYRSYGFVCSAIQKNRPFRVWKLDFCMNFWKMQKCE